MVSFNKKSENEGVNFGPQSGDNYLTLHNDDVNTFDHVIDSLCEICDHNEIQAEQCALITHFKGKCDIKKGSAEELALIKEQLTNRQLSVTID
jgi:ATP-dependent Clp protease adaptor protein ClpS